MEVNIPIDFGVQLLKDGKLLWHDPKSLDHDDVRFEFGDFAVNVIIVDDFDDIGLNTPGYKSLNDEAG
jgi:hypothetical protein